ncbi:MAG TPA: hypothetical protein VKB25_11900 [Conexibacter sp.]|nr:hypothetical protein [Conexibacter sp.]
MSVKLILTALAASVLLSAAVCTASARSLSITNQNLRITWASLEIVSAASIRCAVTLEGSFHTRTIAKVTRALIGYITRAVINRPCTEGTLAAFNGVERYNGITPANTLPWHVTYEGFTGSLPAIASLQVLVGGVRLGLESLGCAVQFGEATDNITGSAAREAGGGLTTLTPVEGRNEVTVIRTDRDPFGLCPRPGNRTGRLRGPGNVFLLGTNTRISITLI